MNAWHGMARPGLCVLWSNAHGEAFLCSCFYFIIRVVKITVAVTNVGSYFDELIKQTLDVLAAFKIFGPSLLS
jgi:hypothetical protein